MSAAASDEQQKLIDSYVENIHYSNRYSDGKYEYRHVILPKQYLKYLPKQYFSPDKSGCLRILNEDEWRGVGIMQSLGWEHYEVHAPEPHILLFRRALNTGHHDTKRPEGKARRK